MDSFYLFMNFSNRQSGICVAVNRGAERLYRFISVRFDKHLSEEHGSFYRQRSKVFIGCC